MECTWPGNDALMREYHDTEWGVPCHNDAVLFEYLVLDAAQAGLSWRTILYRREGYRQAFDQFDPVKIAAYTDADRQRLLQDAGIIRNRLKIESAIKNARAFLAVQQEFGTFAAYIWSFVDYKPIINQNSDNASIQASSPESDMMSTDMKRRGFSFVGSTICYAFMQAAGLVNDHVVTCSRHQAVQQMKR